MCIRLQEVKKKSRYEFARALLIDYGAGRRNILLVVLLLLLLASCRARYPFFSCALLLRVHALVHWPVTWTNGRTGQDASVIYDGNPTKKEHEDEAKKTKEEEEAGRTNANVNMHTISLRLKP